MFELFILLALIVLIAIAALALWVLYLRAQATLSLERVANNPILSPVAEHWWESEAVFNPAAYLADGKVHILYRALGADGISRVGYASSHDGVTIDERLSYPIYTPTRTPHPQKTGKLSYATLSYDTVNNPSGGGWGGIEDPRVVEIEGRVYMTFTAFDGWGNIRMGLTTIASDDFKKKYWQWTQLQFLSPPGEVQKNWLLFPEKINNQFAILHSISPNIKIEFVDSLEEFDGTKFIRGSSRSGGRPHYWDKAVRGAGAPPLKTKYGWLLLYHAYDPAHADIGYKVGAMLLDLKDPSIVLYRSSNPVLEAREWYENDWKPGVTYASGAVIKDDELFVYYGGGDKRIAVAKTNLDDFLHRLMHDNNAVLQ